MSFLELTALSAWGLCAVGTVIAVIRWRSAAAIERPLYRAYALVATGPTVMATGFLVQEMIGSIGPGIAACIFGLVLIIRGARDVRRRGNPKAL